MQMFNELSDVTCSNSISVYISQQLSRAHCTPTFAGTNKCHSLSNKPFILSIKTDKGGVSIGKVQRLMCGYANTRTVPMASANFFSSVQIINYYTHNTSFSHNSSCKKQTIYMHSPPVGVCMNVNVFVLEH